MIFFVANHGTTEYLKAKSPAPTVVIIALENATVLVPIVAPRHISTRSKGLV